MSGCPIRQAVGDTAEQKLDKLEALFVGEYGRPREDLRFIAAMLSMRRELVQASRNECDKLAPR
jgi:hypothetical protein